MKTDKVIDKAERRRVPRADTQLYLQAREVPFSEHNRFNGCICKNISAIGACISTFSFYPVDKSIYLESYSGDTDYSFKVIGRVVWGKELSFQGKFKMGIEWSDFSKEEYEHLKNYIIKKLKTILFLLALSLMNNPLGFCFNEYDQRGRSIGDAEIDKGVYMEVEQAGRKEGPFSPLTAEASFISQASISQGMKETVTGLKSVGFSTADIVKILKNGNNNAVEISIACLNVNISGEDIYNALINAGFSQPTVDEAVPQSLRNDKQLYDDNQSRQADVNASGLNTTVFGISELGQKTETSPSSLITNDALLENTVVALKQANVSIPQVINVLRDMGVSAEKIIEVLGKDIEKGSGAVFKGLGEWASFQNNRFGQSEQASARKSELINSMLASGFNVGEIFKGFIDSGVGKNNAQKGKMIRVTVADIANAGVKFEAIIGVLKDLGFSAGAISDALTGKSDSFMDKLKSGMFFSGEKNDVAAKVINNLTQGGTLNSAVEKLQEQGDKPAVIADALKFMGVSSAQIAEVLN